MKATGGVADFKIDLGFTFSKYLMRFSMSSKNMVYSIQPRLKVETIYSKPSEKRRFEDVRISSVAGKSK
jgi:hypothetical protein